MRTIDAFEKDVAMQLDYIRKFSPLKPLSQNKQQNTIFCGTGDSYAASQVASILSNFRVRAFDPLDLLENTKLLRGSHLYLVSVSGNTASNINLARKYKRTTAITAAKDSRLARACRSSIILNFDSTGVRTAGSISFLASVLTCISLVMPYNVRNAGTIFREAAKAARSVLIGNKVYILGNLHTMPLAMFCAAKLYEVIGADAHYERIEQFSHMGLFSARRGDSVIIFEQSNAHNAKLLKALRSCGLRAYRIGPRTQNLADQVLFFTLAAELVALYAAKKKKKKDCFFIEENELRNASSSMIY